MTDGQHFHRAAIPFPVDNSSIITNSEFMSVFAGHRSEIALGVYLAKGVFDTLAWLGLEVPEAVASTGGEENIGHMHRGDPEREKYSHPWGLFQFVE